jgi:glucose/arabinose dehydrogenase
MTYAFAAADKPFIVTDITSFDEPWALAFLPDGRLLVTEKKGKLLIVTNNRPSGRKAKAHGSSKLVISVTIKGISAAANA